MFKDIISLQNIRLSLFIALILALILPIHSAMAAPKSIAVTTSKDIVDASNVSSLTALQQSPGPDGRISLREAMLAAEATPPGDAIQISFNISPAFMDVQTKTWEIYLNSFDPKAHRTMPLPALKRGNVSIDASTQPGDAPLPRVFVNGFEINEPVAGDNIGFRIQSASNTIHALGLINFYDTAIVIEGSTAQSNVVSGCMIGASAHGMPNLGTYTGIQIHNQASNNRIGGPLAGERNMIIGMLVDAGISTPFAGIHISGAGTQSNTVLGNWIGFWPDDQAADAGLTPAPEPYFAGIYLEGQTSKNRIGGEAPNVIAGNSYGIYLNAASENVIAGNLVGLAPDGITMRANHETGIMIKLASHNNIIGGTTPTERNVVSGNASVGIMIRDTGSDENQVIGNYIGLSSNGLVGVANKKHGIVIQSDAQATHVGGSTNQANYIAANLQGGILVQAASTIVSGNVFGLAADNISALAGQPIGIDVHVAAVTIGPHNLIANSSLTGLRVSGDQVIVVQNILRANANSGLCLLSTGSIVISNTIDLNSAADEQAEQCGISGAVLVYGKEHTLRANIIHNNKHAGVLVTNQGSSLISLNSISNNAEKGINLDSGGNDDLAAPIISMATAVEASGQAFAACLVEVFADPDDEGLQPLGSTTAAADGSFTLRFVNPIGGVNITATNTNANDNTSGFSKGLSLPPLYNIFLPMVMGSQ